MSTLPEIQKSISQFAAVDLAELEQIIRKARLEKEQAQKPSLRESDPVSVGTILKSIGTRDEWHSAMLKGRVWRKAWIQASSSPWRSWRTRIMQRLCA
jgi:hypothetical protein